MPAGYSLAVQFGPLTLGADGASVMNAAHPDENSRQ